MSDDSLLVNDDNFIFADEEIVSDKTPTAITPWKVLVVDDEQEIHSITELVLAEITFDKAPLEVISAFSAKEAIEILSNKSDIAIVLLDVVMEKDDSGLETVRIIREELKNSLIRIVLRTGQPGKAPERSVILDYDINDYREKTELTSQKLFTTVVAALRNFRDMSLLEKNHTGMQRVIDSSAAIFRSQQPESFAKNILKQFTTVVPHKNRKQSGFVATELGDGSFIVSSGIGSFSKRVNKAIPENLLSTFIAVRDKKESIFLDGYIVGYFETSSGVRNFLYFEAERTLTPLDIDLVQLFFNNIAIAYENIYLNIELIDTQKDIILRMGDVVENRSKETAYHVYRVAEFSYLLAKKIGLSDEDSDILRQASPMHDVGKVGIPDGILLKPDKLTPEEFTIMKTHTTIGYNIFCQSPREIVQAAATIAYEHHERWAGGGYPQGLVGEDIHIFGRITAIADVFDALASRRSYKKPWSNEEVFKFILENRGTHFDPTLVDAFLELKDQIINIRNMYPDDDSREEDEDEHLQN
jgi:response regulator RpfG family c-di-GMP phosphodiesterase